MTVDAPVAVDYRMVVPAIVAWVAAAVAVGLGASQVMVAAVCAGIAGVLAVRRGMRLFAVTLLVLGAICLVTALRITTASAGPVAALASDGAAVDIRLEIVSDPRVIETGYARLVVVEARATYVEGRGVSAHTREPIVVFADDAWAQVRLGESVQASGVLGPSDSSDQAAELHAGDEYRVVGDPAWWWDASARMRAGVTEAVSGRSDDVAGLVPALVHGDDHALPAQLAEDFRASGLTHLLAVSGTNLTLVVGFLLFLARLLGARGRWKIALGVLGTAGFVLLARPEPSVVRAAAMGVVAIAGLGAGGSGRGIRSLSWAIVGLLLLDPWLARTAGFVLSVCATAGILVLAPPWRDRLARWMPRWCAEAIAVPLAAQLACTPAVAVISGQVSFVAVAANLLVAPAVGPATVLGLLGGVVALVSDPASHLVGWVTGLFAGWIVAIGHRAAALPGAAAEWGTDPPTIIAITVVSVLLAAGCHWALARPLVCVPAVALAAVLIVRPVSIGWPPPGWVMVMCDVGQGDANVLNAGSGEAVVVDTGPDPRPVDRCLDDLGVDRVPLVVLTHDHADHTGGLEGVLADRTVGALGVDAATVPDDVGVPVVRLEFGDRQSVGAVSWRVVGPVGAEAPVSDPSDGAAVNNTSVVLLAEVGGIRILLTGDVEPEAQAAILRAVPDLEADVLKVPHHGSGNQDPAFFRAVDAPFALVSVGADNDYGHPDPDMLELAEQNAMRVVRTDLRGDIAVVDGDGGPEVVTR
ncbi:ComEC/Rec2 family competence protein [Solicola gregarius]|uniref:ComEC/Rec2 family competence protein n=1 Tax=Solicola gregarius TaxID=2908642 RepID=A0AA46YLN0_9ACTN|nr:ComEC/Rec2 family competence protein [Solicola gregarius]UYM05759.1 ComEC/Rec2 family competence protein [Solicola gregarius]